MLRVPDTLDGLLLFALGVAVIGLVVYALIDAVRQRTDAFTAAGKLTKPIWLTILSVGLVIAYLFRYNPLNIFGIIVVVAAGVYLVDVRPAVRNMSGGGGQSGPYGRW